MLLNETGRIDLAGAQGLFPATTEVHKVIKGIEVLPQGEVHIVEVLQAE